MLMLSLVNKQPQRKKPTSSNILILTSWKSIQNTRISSMEKRSDIYMALKFTFRLHFRVLRIELRTSNLVHFFQFYTDWLITSSKVLSSSFYCVKEFVDPVLPTPPNPLFIVNFSEYFLTYPTTQTR